MHYQEHIWFIFNTAAFHFHVGKDVYLYFVLDNMPVLIGLPCVALFARSYYKRYKIDQESNRFNHVK